MKPIGKISGGCNRGKGPRRGGGDGAHLLGFGQPAIDAQLSQTAEAEKKLNDVFLPGTRLVRWKLLHEEAGGAGDPARGLAENLGAALD